jgi:hypothetical protein
MQRRIRPSAPRAQLPSKEQNAPGWTGPGTVITSGSGTDGAAGGTFLTCADLTHYVP